MTTDLETAWTELDAANTKLHWVLCPPSHHEERHQWEQYAFDPAERPKAGARSREWTAVAPEELAEVGVLRVMAACLAEISAGRVPK